VDKRISSAHAWNLCVLTAGLLLRKNGRGGLGPSINLCPAPDGHGEFIFLRVGFSPDGSGFFSISLKISDLVLQKSTPSIPFVSTHGIVKQKVE
jgi:hypothetical protein